MTYIPQCDFSTEPNATLAVEIEIDPREGRIKSPLELAGLPIEFAEKHEFIWLDPLMREFRLTDKGKSKIAVARLEKKLEQEDKMDKFFAGWCM